MVDENVDRVPILTVLLYSACVVLHFFFFHRQLNLIRPILLELF
jgi:hypothetical protein